MNTPAHLALNLAVLGKRRLRHDWWVIGLGAVLPDMLLFLFFFRALEIPTLEPLFEIGLKALNSIPLFFVLFLVGAFFKLRWLLLLSASVLLHLVFDFFLHSDDAREHLYPLSDWVFESPVSFWDAAHYGQIFGILEGVLFIACFGVLWRWVTSRWGKVAMVLFALVYLATFIHFAGHAFAGAHWAVW